MSTNSIPTLSKFSIQTNSTIELYDSLFQILTILATQQPYDLPLNTMTKYNLLVKSSSESSNEILEEIEHNLIYYSQTDYSGPSETIKKLIVTINDIKKLDSLSLKSADVLFLSSVNSSRSSLSSYLEVNEEQEEDIDFETLYRDVSDSLMRIKIDLINWDSDTEVEADFPDKFHFVASSDDLFDLELDL